MVEPTLTDAIITVCTNEITQQRPLPSKVTITAIHGNGYIDITDNNGDLIKNIQYIGTPTINNTGLLIIIENDEWIVIT